MHDFVKRLRIDGLFDRVAHDIDFRVDERVTILTGPNGSGKTHALRILRDLVSMDVKSLARLPFASATLDYERGRTITVERSTSGAVTYLSISSSVAGEGVKSTVVTVEERDLESQLPPYMERLDESTWMDGRDGEILSEYEVRSRFGRRLAVDADSSEDLYDGPEESEWVESLKADARPTFVETGRLDLPLASGPRGGPGRAPGRGPSTARIRQYIERIESQIAQSRRNSFSVSQKADRQFAIRALDKARSTVNESELRTLYEELAQLNQQLNANGLTEESAGVSFPDGRTNPTERRILNLFLDDWRAKLEPLKPVHARLQALRSAAEAKLGGGKFLSFRGGKLEIVGPNEQSIKIESLSSGEQHLLALFSMLLFYAEPGGIVLIDEPEISLHASWKHAFLDDVKRISEASDLQIVLATHSTGIINNAWELVEELTDENTAAE